MIKKAIHYRLPLIAFGTGFGLMAYELVAARVLAPTIGSSTYVWTSVIGVIIAALAVGFFVGGRLADARKKQSDIAVLLLCSAAAIVYTLLTYSTSLNTIGTAGIDSRLQGVLAALLLFAPASFFIGTISPYLAKMNVTSLQSTGSAVASLDVSNSIGGIIGTFVTGFILFGYIGSRETFVALVVLFVALSWLLVPRWFWKARLIAVVLLLLLVGAAIASPTGRSTDTPSAHYEIISTRYQDVPITGLTTGPNGVQSAVFADGRDDLVFWYTKEMAARTIERAPKSVLILGGGAFTLPQYLAEKLPQTTIDVVEIDPELQPLSEQYFRYKNPANVRLFFEDARTYVGRTQGSYDVILVDVYGDTMIPFSMMTREYTAALAERLAPDGIVIANVVAGTTGACGAIFDALNAAYETVFPSVAYKAQPRSGQRANHIVTYARSEYLPEGYTPIQKNTTQPYTDNYAPAERLYYACGRQG